MDRDDKRAADFCEAVETGNGARLRALFEAHPELSQVIDRPWFAFETPALVASVFHRKRDAVEALLDAGADPNVKSAWAAGPYHVLDAIVDRPPPIDVPLADYLIRRGAVLDLHAAAGLGRLGDVRTILDEAPERVSEPGPDGATPLHLALNREVAAFLLECGAEIDKRCVDHKSTSAQWAAQGREDVMRFLLERGARADLFMAAALDDVELAQRLLDEDPEAIDVRVRPGQSHKHVGFGDKYVWAFGFADTPLEVARRKGHTSVCQFLLEQSSAAVRLIFESRQGDVDALSRLLDAEPDLLRSLSEPEAYETLCTAPPVMEFLLEAGANPNVRNDDTGATPMHDAAWNNHGDRLEILLRYGGDVTIRDQHHNGSPLGWASHAGHRDLVTWLADHSPVDIIDAAWLGRVARVREILAEDPGAVRGLGDRESTPLRTAVWFGHEELVRVLLEHGADPSATHPETGADAITIASQRGHDRIVELLRAKDPQE